MIHYWLHCETAHSFDGWFANADAFEAQHGKGLVTCPVCGTDKVSKALMAPAIAGPARGAPEVPVERPDPARVRQGLRALRDQVVREAEYVGDRFAEEARKIHENEIEPKGIYGQATAEEVSGLLEDGIEVMPLPPLPDDHN